MLRNERIIHTNPHHDDVFVAYYPYLKKLVKENENFFIYMTSGYNSVSDAFVPQNLSFEEVIEFKTQVREKEEEKALSTLGITKKHIFHLRSPFYNQNTLDLDEAAAPLISLLNDLAPTVVTLADDPEGIGPANHFKSKQVILYALRKINYTGKIIGYRNVWSRYRLEEATYLIPVTDEDLIEMHALFMECYKSQQHSKVPFSLQSIAIMREQKSFDPTSNTAGLIALSDLSRSCSFQELL